MDELSEVLCSQQCTIFTNDESVYERWDARPVRWQWSQGVSVAMHSNLDADSGSRTCSTTMRQSSSFDRMQ